MSLLRTDPDAGVYIGYDRPPTTPNPFTNTKQFAQALGALPTRELKNPHVPGLLQRVHEWFGRIMEDWNIITMEDWQFNKDHPEVAIIKHFNNETVW